MVTRVPVQKQNMLKFWTSQNQLEKYWMLVHLLVLVLSLDLFSSYLMLQLLCWVWFWFWSGLSEPLSAVQPLAASLGNPVSFGASVTSGPAGSSGLICRMFWFWFWSC